MDMNEHFTSLNPPLDSKSGNSNQTSNENESKRLLNLLKSLERSRKEQRDPDVECTDTDTDTDTEIEESILNILSNRMTLYNHRGLFSSEEARQKHANNFSSNKNNNKGNGNSNGHGSAKKRKRGGGSGSGGASGNKAGSAGNIASVLNIDGGSSTEEAYAISNLCRILIPTNINGNERGSGSTSMLMLYPPSIISAGANVLESICHYCIQKNGDEDGGLSMVEVNMIGSVASQLINGLSRTMKLLMTLNEAEAVEALISCCTCTKNILFLSNRTLSRNVSVIATLKEVAEQILVSDSDSEEGGSVHVSGLVEAAAGLLASIPLVGNSNGVHPMKLWSEMVLQQTLELKSTLQAFVPLVKQMRRGKRGSSSVSSTNQDLEWIAHVKCNVVSQADRIMVFFTRVKGYVAVLTKLMEMEGYQLSNAAQGAAMPITSLLDVSDQLLLLSSVAETRFFATKSKLRDISMEGGLLSPNAAVTVGNSMKYLGYALLESVLSSLSTSGLQYGKRIVHTAVKSLQSSCTLTLKRVIDSSSSMDKNSRKKWLHTSIPLRIRSIEMFTLVAQRLGANVAVTQNEILSKALAFIAGCLLEQITISTKGNDDDNDMDVDVDDISSNANANNGDHWGSQDEKATLVAVCVEALGGSLDVFGGYMSMQNRELIESMASTCISHLEINGTPKAFFSYTQVKSAVLKLGVSCVATPWPDGASSSLVQILRQAAFVLRSDRDVGVSSTAYSVMAICNMAVTPRAPPVMIVTRGNELDNGASMSMNTSMFFSRSSLESEMDTVREDILKAKMKDEKILEDKKKAKKAKEEHKRALSEESKSLDNKMVRNEIPSSFTGSQKVAVVIPEEASNEKIEEIVTKKELDKSLANLAPEEVETMSNESNNDHVHDVDVCGKGIGTDESDEGSEDGFPPIIDCGPDSDDEDM